VPDKSTVVADRESSRASSTACCRIIASPSAPAMTRTDEGTHPPSFHARQLPWILSGICAASYTESHVLSAVRRFPFLLTSQVPARALYDRTHADLMPTESPGLT